MKELLLDGRNYVNEDGDVVPIDHPEWDKIDTSQEPDHYFAHSPEDSVEAPFTPEVSLGDKTPERGASVSLGQRAIAIEAIMGYFNQANKRNGLSKSRGYSEFDSRYGKRAGEVVTNMSKKEERLYREFTRAVDSLIQRDALVAQGFDAESVDDTADAVKRDLYRNYGPGNADYSDRAKLTRKVKTTARRAGGAKR